jgi:RNA polymerase sigma-70 factor (ECF subfamily)
MKAMPTKEQDKRRDQIDAELLEAARAGDEEAFAELWEYYWIILHKSAVRRIYMSTKLRADGQIREKAEDIVNETFLIFWRKLNDIPENVTICQWLWGIMKNVIRGQQKLKKRPMLCSANRTEEIFDDEEKNLWVEIFEDREAIRVLISKLDEAHRECLNAYYVCSMTQAEVGEMLGLSRESARRRIKAAIEKLKLVVENEGYNLGDFHHA